MEDDLNAWNLDHFVEGSLLRNIGNDDRLKLVLAQARVGFVNLLCLFLRANSGYHGVAAREQRLEDMGYETN